MIMAVASPQVELLISLFFSEDDVNFSYVSYMGKFKNNWGCGQK